jgi:hypothetical protein
VQVNECRYEACAVNFASYIDYGGRVNIFVIIKAGKFLNASKGDDGNFRQIQKWRTKLPTNCSDVAQSYGATSNICTA